MINPTINYYLPCSSSPTAEHSPSQDLIAGEILCRHCRVSLSVPNGSLEYWRTRALEAEQVIGVLTTSIYLRSEREATGTDSYRRDLRPPTTDKKCQPAITEKDERR